MSVADELEKLANLRDKGALNEEEFQEQKNRLIGKNLSSTIMKHDPKSKKEDNPSTNNNTSSTANSKDTIIGMLFIFVCIYGVWKIGVYAYGKIYFSSTENALLKAEKDTNTKSSSLADSGDDNEKIGFELIKRPEGVGISAFCDRFENIHIIEHIIKTAGALNYPVHIIGYSLHRLDEKHRQWWL